MNNTAGPVSSNIPATPAKPPESARQKITIYRKLIPRKAGSFWCLTYKLDLKTYAVIT